MTERNEIPNPKYCEVRSGNGRCGSYSKYKVTLLFKKGNKMMSHRCHIHAKVGTTSSKVIEIEPYDQMDLQREVHLFLTSLIGVRVYNKVHKWVTGLFVKPNGGLMCISPSGKYKFVYYHQIDAEQVGRYIDQQVLDCKKQ